MGILRLAGLEGLRSSMRKEGPSASVGAKRKSWRATRAAGGESGAFPLVWGSPGYSTSSERLAFLALSLSASTKQFDLVSCSQC